MQRLQTYWSVTMLLIMGMAALPAMAQEGVDNRLYAMIVSGGQNRLMNHERYWNDCAFLYRTLRQHCGLPKDNILVLMSDGGLPDADMLRSDGRGFASSSADLDGDGIPDVTAAATVQMLNLVFQRLSYQLTAADRLFLFFIDHGGTDDGETDSFVWLWDEQRFYDYSLAMLLSQLRVEHLAVVMGQCYSGGFIDDLYSDGRVVMTACRGNEQSWTCPDRDYDEFVYHWTCALNGADEQGNAVMADTNGDGLVSMAEAFDYAKSHDRRPETPQYASWPEALGRQWSLLTLPHNDIHSVVADEAPVESWSLDGIRRTDSAKGALRIVRQNGRVMKKVNGKKVKR